MSKDESTKAKSVTVEYLKRAKKGDTDPEVYRIMDELIEQHHDHLKTAKIAICWKWGWRADSDGRVRYAQAKKASEVDRALRRDGNDFVLLLNHEIFNSGAFKAEQARYWIDHALECCKESLDQSGEARVDEKGGTVWRVRKPTLEVFPEVYARHGCCTQGMAHLRGIVFDREAADRPLIAMLEQQQHDRDLKAEEADEDEDDVTESKGRRGTVKAK